MEEEPMGLEERVQKVGEKTAVMVQLKLETGLS
jgi:hypothetical protein